jgi:hypothetical protein
MKNDDFVAPMCILMIAAARCFDPIRNFSFSNGGHLGWNLDNNRKK